MNIHRESRGAAGRDFVFLHGWAMHGGLWNDLAQRLADHRRISLFDLPGHGRSDPLKGPYTLERITDAIAAALPAPRVTLIGWSLGGLIALELALRHPAAVRELVLIGGTPQFTRGPDWPDAIRASVLEEFAAQLDADPQTTIRRFLSLQVRGSDGQRRTLSRLRQHLGEAPPPDPAALSGGLDILRGASLRERLGQIEQPVTLIHGTRDTLVPCAAASATANRLPNAVLRPVTGAGHAPFLSHPGQCAALLRDLTDDA